VRLVTARDLLPEETKHRKPPARVRWYTHSTPQNTSFDPHTGANRPCHHRPTRPPANTLPIPVSASLIYPRTFSSHEPAANRRQRAIFGAICAHPRMGGQVCVWDGRLTNGRGPGRDLLACAGGRVPGLFYAPGESSLLQQVEVGVVSLYIGRLAAAGFLEAVSHSLLQYSRSPLNYPKTCVVQVIAFGSAVVLSFGHL
jgi:hypothetical protein